MRWIYAVATWYNGEIYIMSEWFVAKWAARSEMEQMGRAMNYCVMRGEAWIVRRLAK